MLAVIRKSSRRVGRRSEDHQKVEETTTVLQMDKYHFMVFIRSNCVFANLNKCKWEILSGSIILAEVEVQRQTITGFELSVWGTSRKKRKEIENNTLVFLEMVR